LPYSFSVSQNFPNPFNRSTNIKVKLPVASELKLKIFSTLGEITMGKDYGEKQAGNYIINITMANYRGRIY